MEAGAYPKSSKSEASDRRIGVGVEALRFIPGLVRKEKLTEGTPRVDGKVEKKAESLATEDEVPLSYLDGVYEVGVSWDLSDLLCIGHFLSKKT